MVSVPAWYAWFNLASDAIVLCFFCVQLSLNSYPRERTEVPAVCDVVGLLGMAGFVYLLWGWIHA